MYDIEFANGRYNITKNGRLLTDFEVVDELKNAEIKAFEHPVVHPLMKAGCIGEFSVTVEGIACPECWSKDEPDPECEFCEGEGSWDMDVDIPWTTQKDIFKAMCHFKAEALKAGDK